MNLNLLRIFHVSAKLLNFTSASQELNLTQPGISKHIKTLEEYYGTRLFDRLGKKLVLTQAGEVLFKTTEKIFHLIDESGVRIDDLKGVTYGALNIGASITIGTYILPEILSNFKHAHPQIEMSVDISLSRQIEDKILKNGVEIGFVGHKVSDKRLVAKMFRADRLILIVSEKHEWTKRRSPVRLREIAEQPFLLSNEGSGTRDYIENLLTKAGVAFRKNIEFGNTEGVKKAVQAGIGISIVSKYAVREELSSGTLRSLPLAGVNLKRDLYLIYHKDRYLSAAARAFLQLTYTYRAAV